MRLAVLDVGSNTVHLLIVDAHRGARPLPAYSEKRVLRLAEAVDPAGRVTDEGAGRLVEAVESAYRHAESKGAQELLGFATSAIREADNADEVLERVRAATGVGLEVLSGADEARLTFLAARRWFGWSVGRLLLLDLGGGSLEIATGVDEEPDVALSLPLGAGRLTRQWLPDDPPAAEQLRALRRHVSAVIAEHARPLLLAGTPDLVVATSKTFRSLARLAGAAPSGAGLHVRRVLTHPAARAVAERVAALPTAERAQLPGVSVERAPQLPAGAVVAETAMDLLHVPEMLLCPWALREGVILSRLDTFGVEEPAQPGPVMA